MDLKGISWVGNFYQKFEAMCMEVEEIMYQDTVKYVESQVQTVGSSVKRFYSDVMQDLLPPSSVDAAKGANSELPLDFYANVGVYAKPKLDVTEKNIKIDALKKLTEDRKKTTNNNSDYPPTFHRASHVDNLFPLSQEDSTGGALRQNGKGYLSNKSNLRARKNLKREDEKSGAKHSMGKYLDRAYLNHLGDSAVRASKRNVEGHLSSISNLGTSENSKRNNMSQAEISWVVTPSSKNLTWASSVSELSNEIHDSIDQRAKVTPPGSVEEIGPDFVAESKNGIEIVSEQTPDIPMDGPANNVVNLDEPRISREMDMTASSCGTSLPKANAVVICMNDGVISLTESCTSWQVQSSEIASEEDSVSKSGRTDDWNSEVNEVDTSIVHDMEIIQHIDEARLDESCIMVNRDDFHFVPCCEGKSKSYQKKIRDVFSPRKSSTRKHEYEQLAMLPVGDSNPKTLTVKEAKRLPTPYLTEAEWELL